jgi:hypothetical protein
MEGYLFYLTDCKETEEKRLVSLFRSGPAKLGIKDHDARVETVRLNALQQAFDSGVLSFDAPVHDEHRFKETCLDTSDFNPQPPAPQEEIKRYIKHKAYWLGFRYNEKPGVRLTQPPPSFALRYTTKNIRWHKRVLPDRELECI